MDTPFFMAIYVVLAVLGITAFLYFRQSMKVDELGGFKQGTEQYNGYRYTQDNKLVSVDQCDDEKNDPEMNINDEFLEGCKAFFY